MMITDEMIDACIRANIDAKFFQNGGPRDWVRAGLEAALSASPAGVVKPWRLDKALAGYETVMDGSHEAILRFSSEDEFLFFIEAISKGRIMSAIEPAGVGVETAVRKHLEWFERFICDENELNRSTPRKVAQNAQDAAAELRAALKGDEQ